MEESWQRKLKLSEPLFRSVANATFAVAGEDRNISKSPLHVCVILTPKSTSETVKVSPTLKVTVTPFPGQPLSGRAPLAGTIVVGE